ncbi:N-alpha-acetyltransferase 40 [Phlyctochytrium bullatum]|nr:N-alpha-acetyltransferase 40 [Phlyctochytrium bullatum]
MINTGWTDRRKKKEMTEEDGRYLIARAVEDGKPVGFMYFQFLSEESYDPEDEEHEEAAVVYWWVTNRLSVLSVSLIMLTVLYPIALHFSSLELQMVSSWQGKRLGSLMISCMEKLGDIQGMAKAMLTVFKSNDCAMKFYLERGYTPDKISPSVALPGKRGQRYSYEILMKPLEARRSAAPVSQTSV